VYNEEGIWSLSAELFWVGFNNYIWPLDLGAAQKRHLLCHCPASAVCGVGGCDYLEKEARSAVNGICSIFPLGFACFPVKAVSF